MTEEAYKDAIFNLDKKRQDLKQKPKPAADAAIPEFQTMPPATWIGPSALTGRCRPEDMEALSNRLSKVFLEYPELFNHQVYMEERRVDYYRLTSEGQKILQPDTLLSLSARASCRDTKGRIETEYYRLRAGSPGDLPPEEELLKELHQFARHMQAKSRASSVEDLYIGPVLYVDDAAQSVLVGKITEHAHSNWVWYQNRFDLKHRYLGKMAFPAIRLPVGQRLRLQRGETARLPTSGRRRPAAPIAARDCQWRPEEHADRAEAHNRARRLHGE